MNFWNFLFEQFRSAVYQSCSAVRLQITDFRDSKKRKHVANFKANKKEEFRYSKYSLRGRVKAIRAWPQACAQRCIMDTEQIHVYCICTLYCSIVNVRIFP